MLRLTDIPIGTLRAVEPEQISVVLITAIITLNRLATY